MNIDFVKLCGKHTAIYEAYYRQMDPKGTNTIEAMAAAKFLKKSGLSDVVLSRVWDLSDPNGKGFLDKPGFFVALKLVSLAQHGHVYNMNNIYMDTDRPPKVGDLPKIVPPRIQTVPVSAGVVPTGDWSIGVIDRLKYEQLFESLKPVGNMLPGNKVRGVLMESKLPMDTLGKIWDLADQDKDGNLDKHEFIVAMHLVYKTLEKRAVPDILPPELRKPGTAAPAPVRPAQPMPRAPSGEGFGDGGFVANFPKDIAPPPAIPLPVTVPPPLTRVPPVGGPAGPLISTDPLIPIGAPVTANADWVVGAEELKRFEVMFRESDRDKDGLVSGLEVKNIFIQSGVPQKMLAHIWALCDTNQSGKLTLEQFALAMWMVERKQKGIDPPQVLTANMVPPSMRASVAGVDLQESKPTYTNPELEMISKEIEELAKERRALETEIAQKEADIRIKNGEVRSLQSELDTLSATLKQLETQRGEAQKRLDDLKAQVNKIREQCQKQEDTINEQEGELNSKRSELQKLKDEENALQKEYDENNRELQKLTNHLQNTQLQISSIRSMVTQLMETQRQMTDALLICRAAIEAENTELVSEYQLKIEPDFYEARKQLEKEIEPPKDNDDPFNDTTATNKTNNGFSNGFDNDPFSSNISSMTTTTTTAMKSGFDDSFNTGFDSGFDAFGSSGFGQQQAAQDPFGGDAFANNRAKEITSNFDNDPFASLHAPTGQGQVLSPNTQSSTSQLTADSNKSGPPPRPESPSPALPPKKSKVPPPRPAPPKAATQAPGRPAQPSADAFGSTSADGFADFAAFDNKATIIIAPPKPKPPSTKALAKLSKNKTSKNTSSSSLSTSSDNTSNVSLFENFTWAPISSDSTTTTKQQSSDTLFQNNNKHNNSHSNNNISLSNTDKFAALFNNNNNSTTTASTANKSIIPNASSSSSSTALPIALTTNNNLTRSTTPMQLAASSSSLGTTSIFDSFTTAKANSTNNLSTATMQTGTMNTMKSSVSSIISGPTDFKDDPFKDYRYEDPFNIKDPFEDDEDFSTDPEKVFRDDLLSSDDEKLKHDSKNLTQDSILTTTTQSSSNDAYSTAKSASTLSNEFLHKFDAFNMNPSPVPSQNSTSSSAFMSNSNLNIYAGAGGGGGGGNSSTNNNDDDTTNSSVKSKSNTPIPAQQQLMLAKNHTNNGASSSSPFDNFADFDAFSNKSSTTSSQKDFQMNKKESDSSKDSFFDTSFSDLFDKANANKPTSDTVFDAFGVSTSSNTAAAALKQEHLSAFDAFGDDFSKSNNNNNNAVIVGAATTTTTTATFDAFNDADFEDDFFKKQNLSLNSTNSKTSKSPITTSNTNTTTIQNKFTAFGDDAHHGNNKHTTRHSNNNLHNDENFAKFDAFGDDFNASLSSSSSSSLTATGFGALNNNQKNFSSGYTASGNKSPLSFTKVNTVNLNKVQNVTTLSKVPNTDKFNNAMGTESGANLTEKFQADYSKPETFEDDLQEAIKRSMIDQ